MHRSAPRSNQEATRNAASDYETATVSDLVSLQTSLDPALSYLYKQMNAIPADSPDENLRKAYAAYNEAIANINRATHLAKHARNLSTNQTLGCVLFLDRAGKDVYLGCLASNPNQLVIVRKSATCGAGEEVIIQTIDKKARLIVNGYGDSKRNPAYVLLKE